MPFYTPLRYPGGKRRLVSVIKSLLDENRLTGGEYVEPYAGGASVALTLLMEHYASSIHLNDLSRPIFAFWYSVLNYNEELCQVVASIPLTMDEWYRQRAVYDEQETADLFDLGVATLLLNRTNRSGILSGGVIGGKDQKGDYKLDCRFNRKNLIERVRAIGKFSNTIHLYQKDAIDFLGEVSAIVNPEAFFFLDPPYIAKGHGLYLNNYDIDGHKAVARIVQELPQSWVCTYDIEAIHHGLYPHHRQIEYKLPYVAQGRYRGGEVMFLSDRLQLPASWLSTKKPHFLTSDNSQYKLVGVLRKPA